MMNRKLGKAAAAVLGLLAVSEAGSAACFYRRTMKRNKVKVERTVKMAGTDWSRYMELIGERKAYMMAQPHEDVYVTSFDGLKLHGTYFPGKEPKTVICFHGYTSEGLKDYIGLSDYYMKNGFGMLLVDERAHGKSEGEYIGFGCLDRWDARTWIDWVIEHTSKEEQILLHGISMGGATVLMTSSLKLPSQVRGVVSDCGFTSPKEVFSHVLNSMYHLPAFPLIQISDFVNKRKAGYGLDECNAAREVRNAQVPILLIHGDGDHFVPCRMCEEIYRNCVPGTKKLIVKGASHAECYYKDMEAYENALDDFIGGVIK